MTPTTEELVNRLRESCPATQDMESTEICDNYTEAADTIESLAARVVALEEVVKASEMSVKACANFVRKCDMGEAKSVRSYAEMALAVAAYDIARVKLEDRA